MRRNLFNGTINIYLNGSRVSMKNYRVIYPFDQSVFIEKFTANTFSYDGVKQRMEPYSGKVREGWLFMGDVKNDQFRLRARFVEKRPFQSSQSFIERVRLFLAAGSTYAFGRIGEVDGQAVVDYEIDKTAVAYVVGAGGLSIGCIGVFGCIASMVSNGVSIVSLSGFAMIALLSVWVVLSMQIPRLEADALVKFMEDLGA